jgi:23S rRNA (cytosine1962-C5)-methyltransferase
MRSLEAICASGYLQIETLLPIPEDVTGTASTRQTPPPCDPAPFNHPTKIALLRVRRKDEAPASCL